MLWGLEMSSSIVCSWLMAACMSISCEKDSSISMLSHRSNTASWSRRRKRAFKTGALSELSGIRNLVNSYLAFEPCDRFCKSSSNGVLSSEFLFGDGSGNVSLHDRRRKLPRAARSGNFALCFVI